MANLNPDPTVSKSKFYNVTEIIHDSESIGFIPKQKPESMPAPTRNVTSEEFEEKSATIDKSLMSWEQWFSQKSSLTGRTFHDDIFIFAFEFYQKYKAQLKPGERLKPWGIMVNKKAADDDKIFMSISTGLSYFHTNPTVYHYCARPVVESLFLLMLVDEESTGMDYVFIKYHRPELYILSANPAALLLLHDSRLHHMQIPEKRAILVDDVDVTV